MARTGAAQHRTEWNAASAHPVRLTKRRAKYRAVPIVVDGIRFASKREARRYAELLLMEKAGQIRQLKTQVPFDLIVNDVKICRYIADFCYEEGKWPAPGSRIWIPIVEDCKGFRTDTYRLKAKLMKACLGIVIRET